nr:hypothetical protein CFP56_43767 [Quercus suber]
MDQVYQAEDHSCRGKLREGARWEINVLSSTSRTGAQAETQAQLDLKDHETRAFGKRRVDDQGIARLGTSETRYPEVGFRPCFSQGQRAEMDVGGGHLSPSDRQRAHSRTGPDSRDTRRRECCTYLVYHEYLCRPLHMEGVKNGSRVSMRCPVPRAD